MTTLIKVEHHYEKWEGYLAGMWRICTKEEKKLLVPAAVEFTSNTELFNHWMKKVTIQWPVETEHNLTDLSSNRRAWLGQAAACLGAGIPEEVTRQSWWMIGECERIAANKCADTIIFEWEKNYLGNKWKQLSFSDYLGVHYA